MNIEDIKKEVSDLKPLTVKFKKHIVAALEMLYPGVDTKEAACLLYLGLDSQPSCRVCGQKTPFYPLSKAVIKAHIGGWNDVCSHKCSTIKNKETSLKKYGVEHHLKSGSSSDALEKQKMTNRTRYGVEHVLQNKDINQKMQDRIREENSGFHYMNPQSESGVPEKIKHTTRMIYGEVDHFFQTEECKRKSVETNLMKTGYMYPSQSPEIRRKTIETWLLKHGVENVFQSRQIIDECAKTRYRRESERHENENARRFYTNVIEYGDVFALGYEIDQMQENGLDTSLIGIYRHTGIPISHIKSIALKSDDVSEKINRDTRMSSYPERNLSNTFQSIGVIVSKNDRSVIHPKEIDIFFPDHKVGVEVNGVYYHSEYRGGKDSKYHLNKTIDCVSKGIKLFHFTDVQLDTKKDIIISMIKHAIGKTETKVHARKTRVVQLQKGQFEWFFEENHIDGNATAKFAIGLYHGDDLVMCMSMGYPRNGHDKRYEFEIIRLATKLNTHVVGGFQKIWNYLIKEHSPSSIMSYQDRRYGGMMSSAYSSVMKLERITDPSWEGINIKSGEVRHRLWFTSNRLKEKFPETYDETKTVKQNMIDHGYDRIWNCGQYVWSWTS
jgi:hypothetical protein